MANLLSTNVSGRLYTSGYVDTNVTGAAFRFYDGTTFRGGLGLDDWAHSGSAADITMYVAGAGTFYITTNSVKRHWFNGAEVAFRTYAPDLNYKTSFIGGDQLNTYYGAGSATLYIQYHNGVGGNFNVGNGKLTVDTNGVVVASGSLRAPIFYDSNDTTYYLDPNSSTSGYFAGTLRQNVGKYVRDSYHRTISGYGDYYSGGGEGWTRVAEIRLTSNCTGAVIFGTLYDHRYSDSDAYQISIVARADCDFTSNNESHYINVGCTIIGSTGISNYRDKVRVLLIESSPGSRKYEVQFYETGWNHNTWQLETTGWTILSSAEAPSASVGGERVNYMSNQNADNVRANSAVYAPTYYDSNDTGFYLNPNGESVLNQISAGTSARWGRSGNFWTVRPNNNSGVGYWTGTNGWGTGEGTWANAWKGGFSGWDIWGTGTDHPQGSGYVHAQGIVSGIHYTNSNGSSAYGWMMVGAADATANRYWLRGKWDTTTSAWVEMITTGNIASQSVSYADESGYSSSSGSVEWTSVQNKPATFTPSSHNHDDRYYTETEINNITHQWEWRWIRRQGYVAPAGGSADQWTTYYLSYFTERTNNTEVNYPEQGSGYINTITNVGSEGGFGGSNYGNIFGDLDSYHCLIYTNIFVEKEFRVNVSNFNGDDPHAIFIDGVFVHGNTGCCTDTSYIYTFKPGWHRIDLIYAEGGGGDFIRMGWNPKDYTANIKDMTPHRAGENPRNILDKFKNLVIQSDQSVRAPIFYDSDNTNYYVNPNSISRIDRLQVVGDWGGATPNDGQINIRGSYPSITFRNTISNNMWLRHMDGDGEIQHYFASNGIDSVDWSIKHSMRKDGTFQSNGSMRAPIFYDSQDTGYFVDPNATSNLNSVNAINFRPSNAIYFGGGNNYFNWTNSRIYSNVGIQSASDMLSPIFYDSNDTNYFVDPNSTSQLSYVLANNWFRPQGNTGVYFQTYGRGIWAADSAGSSYGSVSIYGSGLNDWPGWAINNLAVFMARDIRRGIFIPSADSWLIRYEESVNEAFVDFQLSWGSDIRYKSNVNTISSALDKVTALRGVTYNYKGSEKTSIGFIAQEVEQVVPEVVSTDIEGFKGVGYANMVALLTEAIKEQQTIINDLKARIELLESK